MADRSRDGRWLPAAAAAAYTLAVTASLVVLFAAATAPAERARVAAVAREQLPLLLVGGTLALAGLAALVAHLVGRHTSAVRRLTAETRLLLEANPDHVLGRDGPAEVAALAEAIGLLAGRRRAAEHEVADQVAAAQAQLLQERNQLAALMAELAVAVVVCNADGRILLYNAAARSLLGDDAAVGIGRSVFGVVDRDLVDHALARALDAGTHTATAVHRGRALEVQVAAVPAAPGERAGFVLLLQDLTDRIATAERRDAWMRGLTEVARARLGSIRAALEALLGYPEMSPEERAQFLGIVDEESRLLGTEVAERAARTDELLGAEWPVADVAAGDLLKLLGDALDATGVRTTVGDPPLRLWLRVDSHAIVRSVVHLADSLGEQLSRPGASATLTVSRVGGHAQLELSWRGADVAPEQLEGWLDERLVGSAAATVREVVDRHGGEVWSGSADGAPHLRVLLPLAEEPEPADAGGAGASPGRAPAGPTAREPAGPVGDHPEFYDFDLFALREPTDDVRGRQLAVLTCTVLDCETTGLDAVHGDEIIAVGAVRIVNGRLLTQECFERLLDPGRDVPAASTAIHGLTGAMLAGRPTVETVLPELARYVEETVLVGHNVGFDLQFLRMAEQRAGVTFRQPALDTLLLDAFVHPDHDDHSLEAVADRLGVPVTGRHSALGDALVTAQVFQRLLPLLESNGVRTLGEALAASQSTLHARLDRRMYGE